MLTRMFSRLLGNSTRKNKSKSKNKLPDFNAFFLVEPVQGGGKVRLFMYGWNSSKNVYTTAMFINGTDYVADSSLADLKKTLSALRKKTTFYEYSKHTPEKIHAELKGKITSFYSLKWFQRQYQFILQQKYLLEHKG